MGQKNRWILICGVLSIIGLQNCLTEDDSQERPGSFPLSLKNQRIAVVSTTINQFGIDFYDFVCNLQRQSNFVISPMTMVMNLLTFSQLRIGKTLKEIAHALRVDENDKELHSDVLSVVDEIISNKAITIKVVNRIYAANESALKWTLSPDIISFVNMVDFTNQTGVISTINNEVKEITSGSIKTVVYNDKLYPVDTNMILVNAIYFKSTWKYPFKATKKKAPFDKRESIIAKKAFIGVGYDAEWETRFIRIPFLGDQLSLLLIVPDADINIGLVDSKLFLLRDWSNILSNIYYMWTSITIPAFKVETTLSTVQMLKHAGINTMFTGKSEHDIFTGMHRPHQTVTDVVHEVLIDITESVGATAEIEKTLLSFVKEGYMSPYPVIVQPPFLYIIYHDRWGALLYGKLVD